MLEKQIIWKEQKVFGFCAAFFQKAPRLIYSPRCHSVSFHWLLSSYLLSGTRTCLFRLQNIFSSFRKQNVILEFVVSLDLNLDSWSLRMRRTVATSQPARNPASEMRAGVSFLEHPAGSGVNESEARPMTLAYFLQPRLLPLARIPMLRLNVSF